jgi:glutathione synthase
VEKSASQSFKSLLDFYIENGKESNYVILQEYIEGADQGDVRILVLNGEPIGAMRRIPANNDMRSNVHAGGSVVKHILTHDEKVLCKQMAPKLVRDGLFFVGLDVINGKLIEVNVLSPGGIARINKLNRVHLQVQVVDFIESVVNAKDIIATRKTEFRRVIDDADAL